MQIWWKKTRILMSWLQHLLRSFQLFGHQLGKQYITSMQDPWWSSMPRLARSEENLQIVVYAFVHCPSVIKKRFQTDGVCNKVAFTQCYVSWEPSHTNLTSCMLWIMINQTNGWDSMYDSRLFIDWTWVYKDYMERWNNIQDNRIV